MFLKFFSSPQILRYPSTNTSKRAEIAHALCTAAQMNEAETLILGFRGLSSLNRGLFGSVADYCTTMCPLSVAVVKEK